MAPITDVRESAGALELPPLADSDKWKHRRNESRDADSDDRSGPRVRRLASEARTNAANTDAHHAGDREEDHTGDDDDEDDDEYAEGGGKGLNKTLQRYGIRNRKRKMSMDAFASFRKSDSMPLSGTWP